MSMSQTRTRRDAGSKGKSAFSGFKSQFLEKGALSWIVVPVILVVALVLVAWFAPAFLKFGGAANRSAGCVSPSVSPSASGGYTCGSSY